LTTSENEKEALVVVQLCNNEMMTQEIVEVSYDTSACRVPLGEGFQLEAVHKAALIAFRTNLAADNIDASLVVLSYRNEEGWDTSLHDEAAFETALEESRGLTLTPSDPPAGKQEGEESSLEARVVLKLKAIVSQSGQAENRRQCGVCRVVFSSRNRLFAHMTSTGHTSNSPSQEPGGGASSSTPIKPALSKGHHDFDAYYGKVQQVAPPTVWAKSFELFQQPLGVTVRAHPTSPLAALAMAKLSPWVKTPGAASTPPLPLVSSRYPCCFKLADDYPRRLVSAAQDLGALSRQVILIL
jgi:hypothetical protein